jgi:hypothetical protein
MGLLRECLWILHHSSYDWIPICAGMTEEVQENLLPGSGVSPDPLFSPQEWVARGVKKDCETAL